MAAWDSHEATEDEKGYELWRRPGVATEREVAPLKAAVFCLMIPNCFAGYNACAPQVSLTAGHPIHLGRKSEIEMAKPSIRLSTH
jgi:hypothetical protein